MSFPRLACTAVFALQLAACSSWLQPNYNKPLEVRRDAHEQSKTGCGGDTCPLVNIDTVHFDAQPDLDALVQRSLLQLTHYSPMPASLKDYEQAFLAQSSGHKGSYLQAKVREQHDGLVIVELSSYLDEGTPEGLPGRGFINYSRQQQRALTLQNMLLPGQEQAFWNLAEQAHKAWQVANKFDQDAEFVKRWPFQKTPYVALTYGGVILKYNVNTIAPYAAGHVELKIPYPRLNGVLKPELFPGRG